MDRWEKPMVGIRVARRPGGCIATPVFVRQVGATIQYFILPILKRLTCVQLLFEVHGW
jgi:hypothetical protein